MRGYQVALRIITELGSQGSEKSMGFAISLTGVQIPALLLSSCVTLDTLLRFSEPQLLCFYTRHDEAPIAGLFQECNDLHRDTQQTRGTVVIVGKKDVAHAFPSSSLPPPPSFCHCHLLQTTPTRSVRCRSRSSDMRSLSVITPPYVSGRACLWVRPPCPPTRASDHTASAQLQDPPPSISSQSFISSRTCSFIQRLPLFLRLWMKPSAGTWAQLFPPFPKPLPHFSPSLPSNTCARLVRTSCFLTTSFSPPTPSGFCLHRNQSCRSHH